MNADIDTNVDTDIVLRKVGMWILEAHDRAVKGPNSELQS